MEKINNDPKNATSSGSSKYVFRGFCVVILTLAAEALFFVFWFNFVQDYNWTGYLLGLGNLGMAMLIYFILYVVIGKGLHAFKIGVERTANVVASQVLTFFVVDILEILVSMAITGNFRFFFRFFWIYFLLFLCQSVLSGIMVVCMIRVYRKVFLPLRLIEVDGEHSNDLYTKVNGLVYKYHIAERMNCSEGLEKLEEKLAHYDAVLINDVPAKIENKILKICFSHDKRVYFVPKISDIIVKTSEALNLLDTPLFLSRNIGLSTLQRFVKRTMDIVLSGLALVVLSPLLLITSIAIKLNDGGPIFFSPGTM